MSPGKDNPGDINEGVKKKKKSHIGENFPEFSVVLMVCFPLVSHRNPRQQKRF